MQTAQRTKKKRGDDKKKQWELIIHENFILNLMK